MQFVIIGAGIIGIAIARELAKRGRGPVTILEKESGLGRHASGRNSGVIHSGINQKPGSLKAKMCVEGSRLLREYCRKRNVPMRECGTLVVARTEEEWPVIERVLEMGKECDVPDLRILNQKELQEREPLARGVGALLSPTGATVDSRALLEAVAEEARTLGVTFKLCHRVNRVSACRTPADGHSIETNEGTLQADYLINAAGLEADRIAHFLGVGLGYRIIPFRGEYREVQNCDIRSMIYPPPNLQFPFLGIHLTRETDGRVLAGPSAILSFGREAYHKEWDWSEMFQMFMSASFWKLILSPTFLGLAFQNAAVSFSETAFLKEIQTLVPSVKREQLAPYRSGIRAQMVDSDGRLVDDILVEYREHSTHILNAVSPGLTSSLAFAEHVVERILL